MKLFIGDTIQKLRKIKGLTQEQVANALGITTAAVSKWETNNTYPDISLLSPLARLLGTSVDNILNFKEKLSEEEIDNLLIEANKEFEKSNVIKAMKYCENLLYEYPSDNLLKFHIATVYMMYMGVSLDETILSEQHLKCIELFEECSKSKDNELRIASLHILSNLYIMDNELDKAENVANQLPCLDFDARMIQADILYQKGLYNQSVELEQKCLYQELRDATLNLYSLAKTAYNTNENAKAIKLLDILLQLEETTYINKSLGINAPAILFKIEILMSMNKTEQALQVLEKVLLYAQNSFSENSHIECNIFDKLELENNISIQKQSIKNLVELLENSLTLETLKQEKNYNMIVKELLKISKME